MLKVAVACGKSTALTAGSAFNVKIFRAFNNDGVNPILTPILQFTHVPAGIALINGAVAAGVVSIAYDGAAGVAFAPDNVVCIWGLDAVPASGAIVPNHGVEWLKISAGATTPILFDTPTKVDHHDNEIIGLGSAWDVWLQGGSKYAITFENLLNVADNAMIFAAYIQTYDTDTGT
jgi:hypothetical protein